MEKEGFSPDIHHHAAVRSYTRSDPNHSWKKHRFSDLMWKQGPRTLKGDPDETASLRCIGYFIPALRAECERLVECRARDSRVHRLQKAVAADTPACG